MLSAPQLPYPAEFESTHNMLVLDVAARTDTASGFIITVFWVQMNTGHGIYTVPAYIAAKALPDSLRRPHHDLPFPAAQQIALY